MLNTCRTLEARLYRSIIGLSLIFYSRPLNFFSYSSAAIYFCSQTDKPTISLLYARRLLPTSLSSSLPHPSYHPSSLIHYPPLSLILSQSYPQVLSMRRVVGSVKVYISVFLQCSSACSFINMQMYFPYRLVPKCTFLISWSKCTLLISVLKCTALIFWFNYTNCLNKREGLVWF